jgi:hypothetical protein
VSRAVLDQGPPIGLVTSDDDENVAVNEDHEDEWSEEETGVLPTKAQLSDEIRFASLRLFLNRSRFNHHLFLIEFDFDLFYLKSLILNR